jgi:hypothetical protein
MKASLLMLIALACSALAQSPGTFAATGEMITPRFSHTSTLLPNGKVLITGGTSSCSAGCVPASGAELYNPATGAFTATAATALSQPVGGILLPDGRVFFAEGYFAGTPAGVELYDPSTGNFTAAGNAATLKHVQSAVLLNDGRVLLAGHTGTVPAPVFSAEIFDPAAGAFNVVVADWSQNGTSMDDTNRAGYSLMTLADGRVLFLNTDSGELYNAADRTLAPTGGAGINDVPPASLLLNGKVLFTGGNSDGGNLKSASISDYAAGISARTGDMLTERDHHTITLLPNGAVLVTGGLGQAGGTPPFLASSELYDPADGNFSPTSAMQSSRAYHGATLLNNGQVLITGGAFLDSQRNLVARSSAEIYTPSVLVPAPTLLTIPGDEHEGAIQHGDTYQFVTADNPAVAGEAIVIYCTGLPDASVIPPRVAIGGRMAEILWFGSTPGYPGLDQINVRVPSGVAPGAAVSVQMNYLGRPSNAVTTGIR